MSFDTVKAIHGGVKLAPRLSNWKAATQKAEISSGHPLPQWIHTLPWDMRSAPRSASFPSLPVG